MIFEWMDQGAQNFPFLGDKRLKEMVGHTPVQVLTGAGLGVAVGFLMPLPL
jgi:acid phosphatase family membrane protein YuiD